MFVSKTHQLKTLKFHTFLTLLLCIYLLLPLSILGATAKQSSTANNKNFKCNETEFERCLNRQLMLGDRSFVFPVNGKQVNRRCKEIKVLDKCTRDYVEHCFTGETKTVGKVVAYSVSKANKGYCASTNKRAILASFGACANRHQKDFIRTVRKLNRIFQAIKIHDNISDKVPLFCCNFYLFKEEIISSLTKDCTETESNNIEALVEAFSGDVLNLLCDASAYENTDRCPALLKKLPNYERLSADKVFFLVAVDIVNGIK